MIAWALEQMTPKVRAIAERMQPQPGTLGHSTLWARSRRQDVTLGSVVDSGWHYITRTTYPNPGRPAHVERIAGPFLEAEARDYLDRM